ncbi:MAG TPA: PEP-CTERM sorting domain-containing protein, partial [Lacipirellulaceae bacterium]|nr:PEP-CTERM sorting domain-containing protein [Lacipirellulaceae bacterium]
AKTGSTQGIAAINAYISNLNAAGIQYGNQVLGAPVYPGTINAATIAALVNGGNPFAGAVTGGVNVLYGQNTSTGGTVVLGVGSGGPGNVALDPLRFQGTAYNNSAVIAQGTFGGSLPAFISVGANSTDANVHNVGQTTTPANLPAVDANTTTVVRGDSVSVHGLRPGDANRDGVVNLADFAILSGSYNQAGTTWDQGNFNSTGGTNLADFAILSGNYLQSWAPPATGAAAGVPEPASAALVGLAMLTLGIARKRR